MSKRILTDNMGSQIEDMGKHNLNSCSWLRVWGGHLKEDLDNLYAVIIPDDAVFEGL